MTNSADPDQLAFSEANWSGSTLFAKTGHDVFSKGRVKIVGANSTMLMPLAESDPYVAPACLSSRDSDSKTMN